MTIITLYYFMKIISQVITYQSIKFSSISALFLAVLLNSFQWPNGLGLASAPWYLGHSMPYITFSVTENFILSCNIRFRARLLCTYHQHHLVLSQCVAKECKLFWGKTSVTPRYNHVNTNIPKI